MKKFHGGSITNEVSMGSAVQVYGTSGFLAVLLNRWQGLLWPLLSSFAYMGLGKGRYRLDPNSLD